MVERLSRRGFLTCLLAGAGCLFVGRVARGGSGRGVPPEALAVQIVSAVPDRRRAAALGRAYLRDAPNEASVAGLVAAISSGCVPSLGSHTAGTADLRRALSMRVERDYAEQRLVEVQGWLLAPSEARICALTALMATNARSA
jgi:hypothetical protein